MGQVDRDVVVVGGGILGLMVAVLLAKEDRQVDVFVSSTREPRSDSQRNHSWLQSGLLYPGNVISRSMYYDGLAMLDHFGVPVPARRGIFRFSSAASAEAFQAHAKEIRLYSKVEETTDAEARRDLGAFYLPDCFHFRVPDAPFPEAQVMELARSRASLLGARFRESRVRVERDVKSKTGYSLVTDHERIVSESVVVCAGAGTPSLLESLDIEHPLKVNQSNLLVIYKTGGMRVPLLADRTTGLTVVAWDANEIPPSGRLVVGAGDRRELAPEEQDIVRRVRHAEQEFLLRLLPPDLHLTRGEYRFTAGQKTDVSKNGKSRVQSWVHPCEDLPGLIFATPGKATLAFRVAQEVVNLVNQRPRAPALDASEPPPGTQFEGAIHSHHQPEFDDSDESDGDD